jgi:hypothetical protein
MSTNVTVPLWSTIQHWSIKGRPATQKFVSGNWIGMPGGENPKPGQNYRIEIVWGPRMMIGGTENWLEHVQLRVVFDGWNIKDILKYRDSIQFYTDNTFGTLTSPNYRVHLDYPVDTVFKPTFADVVEYAFFRVTTERDRAWRMKYNIGIYGSVYQGEWKNVTAR